MSSTHGGTSACWAAGGKAHRSAGRDRPRGPPTPSVNLPPGQQVRMRGLAERAAELAAEVRPREAGDTRKLVDSQRFEVPAICRVPGAQEVSGGRDVPHWASIASDCPGPVLDPLVPDVLELAVGGETECPPTLRYFAPAHTS